VWGYVYDMLCRADQAACDRSVEAAAPAFEGPQDRVAEVGDPWDAVGVVEPARQEESRVRAVFAHADVDCTMVGEHLRRPAGAWLPGLGVVAERVFRESERAAGDGTCAACFGFLQVGPGRVDRAVARERWRRYEQRGLGIRFGPALRHLGFDGFSVTAPNAAAPIDIAAHDERTPTELGQVLGELCGSLGAHGRFDAMVRRALVCEKERRPEPHLSPSCSQYSRLAQVTQTLNLGPGLV